MSLADLIVYVGGTGIGIAFCAIVWNYIKGLKSSPRDMWILFLYMFINYVVYAAQNTSLTLWLSADCGLSDVNAGFYVTAWSIGLSMVAMLTGALVDAIGIKKTLLFSVIFLLIARFFMSFLTNPWILFFTGFVPFAIGFAIVGPVVSVAIKRFTTKESAALGFGLFYVIMNMAYAVGGIFFDKVRAAYTIKDAAGKIINDNGGTAILGIHFSTYQMLIFFAFVLTAVGFFILIPIRNGAELNDEGNLHINPTPSHGSGLAAVKSAAKKTVEMLKSVISEKYFWIFLGIITLTIFVRMVFFQFHYTFPKYGLRVLGLDAKIGTIYGVINPALIVFLVPLFALFTKKISSYKLLVIGSIVSAGSCFIVLIPQQALAFLSTTALGEIVFVKFLGNYPDMTALAANPPNPFYWVFILFIVVFTIGEAIWSPKLMQFTAEMAPKGKEGTYLALAILPFFLAKLIAGPMSGILLNAYVPVGANKEIAANYPDHPMVWVWIGAMAIITPIGLLVFRKIFAHQKASGHASGH